MRDAFRGPSSAAFPASAKSVTHSVSRGRKSGRHRNFVTSSGLSAEIPRLASITSLAPRYTSQHTSNAISSFVLISALRRVAAGWVGAHDAAASEAAFSAGQTRGSARTSCVLAGVAPLQERTIGAIDEAL